MSYYDESRDDAPRYRINGTSYSVTRGPSLLTLGAAQPQNCAAMTADVLNARIAFCCDGDNRAARGGGPSRWDATIEDAERWRAFIACSGFDVNA